MPLFAAPPRADRHMVGQTTDPLAPAAGRRRRFFFLVKFRIGVTMELGRSGGTLPTSPARHEVRGHRQQPGRHRLARKGSTPFSRSDISGWRMPLFIPWRGAAARRQAHGRSDNRPARAGCRPTSPILLFGEIPDRGDDGARAIGRHAADVAGATRGTGSSTTARSTPPGAEGLYAVLSLRYFGLADAALYPLARRRRAPTGTWSVRQQTRSRRLPADVADSSFW